MIRKTIPYLLAAITIAALAFASYAFLQMKVLMGERDRFELVLNQLQEEVLRLQEVAVEAQAEAMEEQRAANRWQEEAEALQEKIVNCK